MGHLVFIEKRSGIQLDAEGDGAMEQALAMCAVQQKKAG